MTVPKLRSSIFFASSSILLFVQFLGTAASGWLLHESPWLVCPVAAGVCAATIPISACELLWTALGRPQLELMQGEEIDTGSEHDTRPNRFGHGEQGYIPLPSQEITSSHPLIPENSAPLKLSRVKVVSRVYPGFAPALSFLTLMHEKFMRHRVIQVALLMDTTIVLGMGQNMIVQQWASQVFSWSLSDTTFINAFTMFVSQVVLALTPMLTSQILPLCGTGQDMDWSLTQVNLALRACGAFAMGFSTSPPAFFTAIFMYTLGVGLLDSSKALLTSFTSSADITELYTIQMMVQNVAGMLGSELWPRLFAQQLKNGGLWVGLPFWASAALYLFAIILLRRLPSLWLSKKLDDQAPTT
ncbi:uncharacterized protein RCO7_05320 [Rhynchosporium graminicola]|uniref:Uncharacterized protein n=1 Tax=Rhynchosporium graminicola TaxID=2792576 RepID=A0A1E1L3K9_9HELO|nr:uncharacterized protein RCO7_05320 [Rhynchosporium commune]